MRRRAPLAWFLALLGAVAVGVVLVNLAGDGSSNDEPNASGGRPDSTVSSTSGAPSTSPTTFHDLGLPAFPDFPTFVPDNALGALPANATGGVAVFGDSLTLQAWPYLKAIAEHQGRPISGAAYGGAALCDWLPAIEADLAERQPTDLVLAFAGNNLTPCVAGPDGERVWGADLVANYVRDARRTVELARAADVRVTLVGPPAMGVEPQAAHAQLLRDAFAQLAAELDVAYVDAARALSPAGFEESLPCLPFETAQLGCGDGRVPVRDRDRVHLVGPNDAGYSSGSWRYAVALLG